MIELRSRLKNLMGLVSHVEIGANDYKCEVNCKAVRLSWSGNETRKIA